MFRKSVDQGPNLPHFHAPIVPWCFPGDCEKVAPSVLVAARPKFLRRPGRKPLPQTSAAPCGHLMAEVGDLLNCCYVKDVKQHIPSWVSWVRIEFLAVEFSQRFSLVRLTRQSLIRLSNCFAEMHVFQVGPSENRPTLDEATAVTTNYTLYHIYHIYIHSCPQDPKTGGTWPRAPRRWFTMAWSNPAQFLVIKKGPTVPFLWSISKCLTMWA